MENEKVYEFSFNGNYYEYECETLDIKEHVKMLGNEFLHFIDYDASWGEDSEDGDNGCLVAITKTEKSIILGINEEDVRSVMLGECKILHHYHGEFPVFFNN